MWCAGQVFLYKIRLLFLCYAINFPHSTICHKAAISTLRRNETIVDDEGNGRRSRCTIGRCIARLTIFQATSQGKLALKKTCEFSLAGCALKVIRHLLIRAMKVTILQVGAEGSQRFLWC